MTYTALMKRIWHAIYDPHQDVAETVKQYFHKDYAQCINGVAMGRASYIQHVIEQKKKMRVLSIDYKHVMERDEALFALYCPKGKARDGSPIEAEVIAYFNFKDHKIMNIHGQVRLIKGDLVDVDMDHNG